MGGGIVLCVFIHMYVHLVCSRDQRQPSHYRSEEVDVPLLGTGLALLPRSQTVNQILPGTLVIGGLWLGIGQETELKVETWTKRTKQE